MHVDLGLALPLGERFPARPLSLANETPPPPGVLAQSRTMKGSGVLRVCRPWVPRVSRWRRASWPRRDPRSCRSCLTSTRSGGCSSPSRSAGSRSRSTRGWMTGSGGGEIGALLTRSAASPGTRAALRRHRRHDPAVLARPRAVPARARGDWANNLRPWREPMPRKDGFWRRRCVARVLATIWLSGGATGVSDVDGLGACPPVVEYSRDPGVKSEAGCARRSSQRRKL